MNRDDLNRLEQWCDGTLSPADEHAWTDYLAQRPSVQSEIAAELRLINRLRAITESTASRHAAAKVAAQRTRKLMQAGRASHRHRTIANVMAKTAPRSARHAKGIYKWLIVSAVAAAACLAVVVWWPTQHAIAWADNIALSAGAEVPSQVRHLRFADGSTVHIKENSRVQLTGDAQHKSLSLRAGHLDAQVSQQTAERSFTISTPQGEARVVGTEFQVGLTETSTVVAVTEGRVQLSGGTSTIMVGAGERGLAADDTTYPVPIAWPDKRPLGRLVLSGPVATPNQPATLNANGWLFDNKINVAGGELATHINNSIDHAVTNLQRVNGQGVLLYGIEGGLWQKQTGFVGDPQRLAELAPEFDRIADATFARLAAAGFATGISITPWRLENNNGRWQQNTDPHLAESELEAKITYAKNRWGCSLFYINVAAPGTPATIAVPAPALRAVAARHPEVLLIVEHATADHGVVAGVQALGVDSAPAARAVIRIPWLGYTPTPSDFAIWRQQGDIVMFDPLQDELVNDLLNN